MYLETNNTVGLTAPKYTIALTNIPFKYVN